MRTKLTGEVASYDQGCRLQFRRQSVATSASRLYNFREYERAARKRVTANRTTCYADAQWHNLRAVVPAIKVGF